MLWFHIRNSPLRWMLPLLTALDVAVMFLRNRHWIGVWPETGAAGQLPAYLLGIVGAGAAAWAASAPARHSLHEQLAAARQRPQVAEAYRLAATIAILMVPYIIGQGIGFVLTARTFPPGIVLWLGYVALGFFVTLFCTALGWSCGKASGSFFGALVATLGSVLLIGLLAQWTEFVVISGRPDVTVSPAGLALRFATVAAVLLALPWVRTDGGLQARLVSASGVIVGIVALAMVLTNTLATTPRRPPGAAVTCVDGRTMICLWPEHEKYVPVIRDVSTRIESLPEAFALPPRINEFGIEQSWSTDSDGNLVIDERVVVAQSPSFSIIEGSRWSLASNVSMAILAETFGWSKPAGCRVASSDADFLRVEAVQAWLEAYLAGGGRPDYHTNAPKELQEAWSGGQQKTIDMSTSAQLTWAASEIEDIRERNCRSTS